MLNLTRYLNEGKHGPNFHFYFEHSEPLAQKKFLEKQSWEFFLFLQLNVTKWKEFFREWKHISCTFQY